jgi:myo-inositol-1(or 4)-monophosphatase
MQSEYSERLELAMQVARSSGALALSYFDKRDELTVSNKGLQDRVTKADQEVERHIFKNITDTFPNDGFLGEEMASGDQINLVEEGTWVVDPIDGTDCFIYGLPSWCISIAWMQKGEAKIGVIYDPMRDELYSACVGHGAKLNDKQLQISGATELSDGLIGMGYSTRIKPVTFIEPLQRLLEAGGMFIRSGSCATSMAWVASGRFLGYYEPHINSWDCLAGIVLVREAGGWVNDFLAEDGLTRGNPIIAVAPGLVEKFQMVCGYQS